MFGVLLLLTIQSRNDVSKTAGVRAYSNLLVLLLRRYSVSVGTRLSLCKIQSLYQICFIFCGYGGTVFSVHI